MPKRWNRRYLILFCLLIGALALTACGPVSLWKAPAPQHSLARDGGARLTLHVACLPTAPNCDLTKQRDATAVILSRRINEYTTVPDAVVRSDGSATLIVELPGMTSSIQIADIIALLMSVGSVTILDTGDTFLSVGTNIAGQTCTSACDANHYRIMFTDDQIDRSQVGVQQDTAHGGIWLVQFKFAGSARQQFASYTASHVGQYLTITANDVVIDAAVIQSEINGAAQISGMDEVGAKRLAAYLKSGSLPAGLTLVTSAVVMPSGS